MTLLAPGLRLPRHRATTAHLCAAYPFHAEAGLGGRGIYLGSDRLAGDAAFCFDPFDLYSRDVLTNPNMVVLGEPGRGKSAAVKTFLYRSIGALRSPGGGPRWAAICDPKGEYQPVADALGLVTIRLHPGGATRLNPLDAGPSATKQDCEELSARRTTLVAALAAGVLRRPLTAIEDAAIGWSVADITAHVPQPTLADVARVLTTPTASMVERAACTATELIRSTEAARFALDKLLARDLRGMFDGPSTIQVDWTGRGVVLDLSAVHSDADALGLVMIAATAWLQAVLAPAGRAPDDGPRRLQVIDEAWALLGNERTARYLQACWKLCRSYGVANIAVAHRISDLRAQADDGTATAKLGAGLLADTQTRVLFRQSSDQIAQATDLLGLTPTEADLLPRLAKGRALWKVAGISAVVAHVIAPGERQLVDTDAQLRV